jgi:hypothetical protein
MDAWRPIPGFPSYDVHPNGRIRSWRYGGSTPIALNGTVTKWGYRVVMLRNEGGQPKRMLVHRAVALAFLPNPHNFTDVAHLSGKTGNNSIDNLAWMSHQDNQKMMIQHGTQFVACKLTASEVAEIRARHLVGKRGIGKELAGLYGVSEQQISKIVKRQRWKQDW